MEIGGRFNENSHVWLSDNFSVPASQLCKNSPPSPDTDFTCVKAKNHKGACEFDYMVDIRDYSWKEKQ